MAILPQHCTGPWQDPTCGAWECPWGKELGLVYTLCPNCFGDGFTEEGPCDACNEEGFTRQMDACEACGRKDIE